jgi:ligand-binding sensor domain-containing protein
MKKIRLLITASLFIAMPCILMAEAFSFRHYKAEDGLSFNTVRNIIQDRYGFMWIGTEDCLNRFDGNTFKIYHSNNHKGLISNYISALHEGKNGIIYIGTDLGLSLLNNSPKNSHI